MTDDSDVTGQTVEEADCYEVLTFVVLVRGGKVEVPDGTTRIELGDKVLVIGRPDSNLAFGVAGPFASYEPFLT